MWMLDNMYTYFYAAKYLHTPPITFVQIITKKLVSMLKLNAIKRTFHSILVIVLKIIEMMNKKVRHFFISRPKRRIFVATPRFV